MSENIYRCVPGQTIGSIQNCRDPFLSPIFLSAQLEQ